METALPEQYQKTSLSKNKNTFTGYGKQQEMDVGWKESSSQAPKST